MQFYCQNMIRQKKDNKFKILLTVYVLKNGVGRYNIFFYFLQKAYQILLFVSFSCRIRQCFVFDLSTCRIHQQYFNKFAHAQSLSRITSLCRSFKFMNSMHVNIECFTGWKRIKQRRISFVLGYLRMIL